jgi:hypothetical protein
MAEPVDFPLDPREQAALQAATDRLARLLEKSRRFVRYVTEPPKPGSRMAAAFQSELRDPYEMAYVLIVSAEDHFDTILQIKSVGRLPKFGLYPVLRSAGEAVVRCSYLLDPKLNERDRLARALNERLENLKQVRLGSAQFKQRLRHFEVRARANGIRPIPEKLPCGKPGRGPTTGFNERRKSLTQMFTDYLPDGRKAFRFLSGMTHSRPWVQLRLELARPTKEPGISEVKVEIDVPVFVQTLARVTDLHDDNIRLWFGAAGYDAKVWSIAKS